MICDACGSEQHDARHQRPRNVELDSGPARICHGQYGRNCGAGRDRLKELGAFNALAIERPTGEHFEPVQALGQQQNARYNRCARKMTRECGVIDVNAESGGCLDGRNSAGTHLSTAP
jgi:hypothetical protein